MLTRASLNRGALTKPSPWIRFCVLPANHPSANRRAILDRRSAEYTTGVAMRVGDGLFLAGAVLAIGTLAAIVMFGY
jgi:hypothetical protein